MIKFELIAGTLCLDFINTTDRWVISDSGTATPVDDELLSYEALASWHSQTQLGTTKETSDLLRHARSHPVIASQVLERARSFRESSWHVFAGLYANRAPHSQSLERLNAELERLGAEQLVVKGKKVELSRLAPANVLEIPLSGVVEDFIELFRSNRNKLVRMCAAADCGWFFLDTSKNHKRRWCDMKDCGNREKARRFYERSLSS